MVSFVLRKYQNQILQQKIITFENNMPTWLSQNPTILDTTNRLAARVIATYQKIKLHVQSEVIKNLWTVFPLPFLLGKSNSLCKTEITKDFSQTEHMINYDGSYLSQHCSKIYPDSFTPLYTLNKYLVCYTSAYMKRGQNNELFLLFIMHFLPKMVYDCMWHSNK